MTRIAGFRLPLAVRNQTLFIGLRIRQARHVNILRFCDFGGCSVAHKERLSSDQNTNFAADRNLVDRYFERRSRLRVSCWEHLTNNWNSASSCACTGNCDSRNMDEIAAFFVDVFAVCLGRIRHVV